MQRAMNALMRNQHPRHRIDVDRYYAMGTEGLLAEDARVELIEGEIIDVPPIGISHGEIVDRLSCRFHESLGRFARVRVQGVVRLDRFSQPQPDLALLTERPEGYAQRHPHPEDVLLIVGYPAVHSISIIPAHIPPHLSSHIRALIEEYLPVT